MVEIALIILTINVGLLHYRILQLEAREAQ